MDCFVIRGGQPLQGCVPISGAKNAVLPIMAAAALTSQCCVIRRVPNLTDVRFMGEILEAMGVKVQFQDGTAVIHAEHVEPRCDYHLVRKMRASVCLLGPLLARTGSAQVSLPGGCVIGPRPIDLHLKGMRSLGARLEIREGYICASAERLQAAEVFLGGRAGPTVLGTANVMMAATLAEGVTVIESAACEPEVVDLAGFLNAMGARVEGAGSPFIKVTGVRELHGAEYEVIPDRIEAATYALAAAITNGEVVLKDARPGHLHAVTDKLLEAGVEVERRGADLTVRRGPRLVPVDVTTQPYAGFPTDVQAQFMVLMMLAEGISVITERIYESRFTHASELARLGAQIAIEGPNAIIKGGAPLSGARVMASDLRASAALVLAGLAAPGITVVRRIYHLDRGYECMEEKLRNLGANLERGPEPPGEEEGEN